MSQQVRWKLCGLLWPNLGSHTTSLSGLSLGYELLKPAQIQQKEIEAIPSGRNKHQRSGSHVLKLEETTQQLCPPAFHWTLWKSTLWLKVPWTQECVLFGYGNGNSWFEIPEAKSMVAGTRVVPDAREAMCLEAHAQGSRGGVSPLL